MNLHAKLFAPAVLLIAFISVIMHFYWLPNYMKIEAEDQLKSEYAFADILSTALVPDLLNNDFAKTYATLNHALELREFWRKLELEDRGGARLYPLSDVKTPVASNLEKITHDIIFEDDVIARFNVWLDVEASSASRVEHIRHLEAILLSTLLVAALFSTVLQDRLIRSPLQELSSFAGDIASGMYDSSMTYRSRDEVGKLVSAFTSMRDKIRMREGELLESEARIKAIIENAIDGIISIDARGHVMSFNPAAEAIFGYRSNEVIGQNVNILMPQPYRREHDGYLYNYLSTGKKKVIGIGREVEGMRKDGSTFPLELAVSEVELNDGLLFIGIIRDITERKRNEQMKNEFVSTVSHELRTPLTSIRGAISLVLGKAGAELSPKIKRMLETANRNSERLTFLINDILDLEKINSGKLEFHLEAVNLEELTKRAIDENEGYASSHNTSLRLVFDADAATTVLVDAQRLLQVFANLISNAVKYSPDNGVVEIVVRRVDDRVRISVIDKGPGIPLDFRPKIFGRFAQADSSDTREKGGSGLGLTITRAIIEQLGGHIGFDSEIDVGTEFYFELTTWEQTVENTQHEPSSPKVLVCEDDTDVAYVLTGMLEEEGLCGDIAGSAAGARELLERNTYQLMLLDLKLPDANGLDLVRELRSNDKTRKLPIVVISGRASEGRKEFNGDAVSIADWLQKPVDRGRLINALKDSIHKNQRPNILHVEDDLDVIQVSQMLFEELDFSHATSLTDAREKLASSKFDLVIIDLSLPDGSGLELLEQIDGDTPVVLFSGQETNAEINERVAASLTKSRASNDDLMQTVKRLLNENTQIGAVS